MTPEARGALLLLALAACAAPPPAPAAPAPPAPPAPSALASSAFAPVPEPPPTPRFQIPAPHALVARAAAPLELRFFPLVEGPIVAVFPASGASPVLASIEGDQVRPRPELIAGFPTAPAAGTMTVVGLSREAGALWAQLDRSDEDGIRSEFWRLGERWSLVDSASPGETGVQFRLVSRGAQALVLGHGSLSQVPFFLPLAPASAGKLPAFSRSQSHPEKCASNMLMVASFRAFAGGEALAIGPSCSLDSLVIERWRPGAERPETAWVRGVLVPDLREIERLSPGEGLLGGDIAEPLSPDEILLRRVFLEKSPGALRRVRLLRRSGVWKTRDEGPEVPSRGASELVAAAKAIEREGGAIERGWLVGEELYFMASFPAKGPATEHVLVRRSPVRDPLDWSL